VGCAQEAAPAPSIHQAVTAILVVVPYGATSVADLPSPLEHVPIVQFVQQSRWRALFRYDCITAPKNLRKAVHLHPTGISFRRAGKASM
jgi:hypothetical protein